MTIVKFYVAQSGYTTIECIGHTGYADSGTDIVCASLSSIINSLEVGLRKVLHIRVKTHMIPSAGYIRIDIPSTDKAREISILCDTARLSVKELAKEYGDYIKLEVIDEKV